MGEMKNGGQGIGKESQGQIVQGLIVKGGCLDCSL